ncbi:MAG: acyl-CoA dehydrogenase domain-containing protein, partial [Gammaproteobacteria bacterium]
LARVSNRFFRAVALGWSGALLAPRPSAMRGLHRLTRQASRLSEAAALTVELMLVQKGRELLADSYAAARLADVSAEMFAVSAVLRRYHLGGQEESERPLAKQALVAGIANAQFELRQLLENNAPRWLHATVRCAAYPYGWPFMAGTDMAELRAAQALVVPSTVRDRLTAGIFLSSDKRDSLARLENALSLVNAVAPLAEKLRSGERVGLIQGTDLEEKLASAEAARLLAASDAQLLREAEALRREVMAMEIVDVPAGSVDKKRTQA